ncbi:hypothetical protein OAX78_03720, partial [Planctomycetota bacterium]|nr:hypothetical protein [Planctomycetota bacterium]
QAAVAQVVALGSVASVCALVLLATVVLRRRAARDRAGWIGGAVALGALLLVSGVIPYVLVGKLPLMSDAQGWGTRVCLLMGLPGALLFVAAAAALVRRLEVPGGMRHALVGAAIAGGLVLHVHQSLRLQAAGVESHAILEQLAARTDVDEVRVFVLDTEQVATVDTTFTLYAWPFALRSMGGSQALRHVVFREFGVDHQAAWTLTAAEIETRSDRWLTRYNVDLGADPRQALLVLRPGSGRDQLTDPQLVARYLRLRWFQPDDLEALWPQVVRVEVVPEIEPRLPE